MQNTALTTTVRAAVLVLLAARTGGVIGYFAWVRAGTPAVQVAGWFQRAWVQAGMVAVHAD